MKTKKKAILIIGGYSSLDKVSLRKQAFFSVDVVSI